MHLFVILLLSVSCGSSFGSLIKLVSKCTTSSGVGRCTNLPASCMDMGGIFDDEVVFRDGTKSLDGCADDEICCVLPTIPVEDSCTVCGKKGSERTARKSSMERTLQPLNRGSGIRTGMRVLRSAPNREARIMNGNNADKNEWCWQVALLNTDGTVLGSGALIDGRYIVTAAHKVIGRNSSNLIVLLGQYDFSNPITAGDSNSSVWYARPLEVIIHERYDPETMDNNIALIRIPLVSCNAGNICPVCLNDISDKISAMPELSNCYIAGWGASVGNPTTPVLQEAPVRILRNEQCLQRFTEIGLGDLVLPYSVFCAEGVAATRATKTGKAAAMSTCSGDGGGPLVCEHPDGKWRLMGIIAMGLDDCKNMQTNGPTVFVNAGLYVNWIQEIRRQRSHVKATPLDKEQDAVNFVQTKNFRQPKIIDAAQSYAVVRQGNAIADSVMGIWHRG